MHSSPTFPTLNKHTAFHKDHVELQSILLMSKQEFEKKLRLSDDHHPRIQSHLDNLLQHTQLSLAIHGLASKIKNRIPYLK